MGNDGASLRRGGCELSCAAVAAERERALPSHPPPALLLSLPRSGRAITMSTEQDMIIHRERETVSGRQEKSSQDRNNAILPCHLPSIA